MASTSWSSSSSFLRFRVLLPVAIAIFLTPIPTRLGFWKFLLTFDPRWVGILPCTIPSKSEWGFTLEDLYGGGNRNGDGKPSQSEQQRIYRNRLWGQTALVTGANSGTGYEIALAMARLGVKVTLACRNPTKCQAAADRIRKDYMVVGRGEDDRGIINNKDDRGEEYVTTMTVDTSSLQSVKTFCEAFLERSNGVPLDMLYLNAGIGARATLPDGTNELSVDGIELTFATNVVGHHLMYQLLRPIIHLHSGSSKRKTPARIVLTSSAASYDTRPYDYKIPPDLETLKRDPVVAMSHYNMSKLAQILWARELTARLDSANADTDTTLSDYGSGAGSDPNSVVYVNSAHPGAVATGIWDKAFSNSREMDEQKGIRNKKWEGFIDTLMGYFLSAMWTSEEGALTLIYLGTAVDELQKQNIRGKYFHPQTQLMTKHPNVYENEEETNERQQKLWDFLDELVADYVRGN